MRRTWRSGLLWSLLASLVLHLVIAVRLNRDGAPPRPVPPSAVEMAIIERQPARPVSPGVVAAAPVPAERPAAPQGRRPPPHIRGPAPTTAETAAAPSVAAGAPASPPAEAKPRGAAPDLSPSAAASTLAGEIARAPREPTCPAPSEPSAADTAPRCGVRADETRPAERLQEHVERAASTVPHLAKNPPPRLRRDTNGEYHYEGIGFTGLIRKDGTVDLTDRAAASVAPIPIAGTFDLDRMLDPNVYSAEKRRFLEETETLRNELAEQERERVLAQGRFRLRGKLEGILANDALAPLQKRAAIFGLWDDCAEDATGSEAQRLVEAFVRERLPRGSSLGYGDAELAELNARRASARRFDSYAKFDGGAG
jgi:hypothetical protein